MVDDPYGLYGGQVAAQALHAAGKTVSTDHVVHSMHGFFLRRGDPMKPVVLEVHRDRDGRSYSARRVIARQDNEIIFHLAASFHLPQEGPDIQAVVMPALAPPDSAGYSRMRTRTIGYEIRAAVAGDGEWPSQLWVRTTADLGDDPLLHACALLYVSDMYTGLFQLAAPDPDIEIASLDHTIWFYRPTRVDDWLLIDLAGDSVSSGRGTYRGHIFNAGGMLVAGLAQESLFRKSLGGGRRRPSPRIHQEGEQ